VAKLLQVAQVSFFTDPNGRTPEELLALWTPLVDVAESAARAGVQVSVLQASSHSRSLTRGEVDYHFLPFGSGSPTDAKDDGFGSLIKRLAPDVIHVHGLGFPRDVLSMAELAPDAAIVVQDHADRPPRFWRRAAWRRCSHVICGVSFCTREHAKPFVQAGLLQQRTRVYEIPESTSRFTPVEKAQARRVAEVGGDPLLLWVGNLDANKDPLTVLAGISAAARAIPGLQLWCCFGRAPLLGDVQRRIQNDPALNGRVHLLGSVPHARVEQLMRAADVFVLGSHHESTGFALIEALACGVFPVVTDIPSFRSMTAAGTVGKLWPCDDSHALADALQSVVPTLNSGTRARMRAHFERELSIDAMGSKLVAMYEDAAGRRQMRTSQG
jgi:glycosyltransferase involved in cell wall biosynthesis